MPDFQGHVCDKERIKAILFRLGRNIGKPNMCASKAEWIIKEYAKKQKEKEMGLIGFLKDVVLLPIDMVLDVTTITPNSSVDER